MDPKSALYNAELTRAEMLSAFEQYFDYCIKAPPWRSFDGPIEGLRPACGHAIGWDEIMFRLADLCVDGKVKYGVVSQKFDTFKRNPVKMARRYPPENHGHDWIKEHWKDSLMLRGVKIGRRSKGSRNG